MISAPDFSSTFLALDVRGALKLALLPSIIAMLFTDLTEAGVNLRMMNLGGGFPVRYKDDVPEIDQFGDAIMTAMTKHFGNNLPQMVIEPGRFIVGDAGLVSAEVVLV